MTGSESWEAEDEFPRDMPRYRNSYTYIETDPWEVLNASDVPPRLSRNAASRHSLPAHIRF